MDEKTLKLMADLHTRNHRQGPGSDATTLRALELSDIDRNAPLKIADIGCGTGAASILLAKNTNAHITAVDFLPEFLEKLQKDAQDAGVADRITTLAADMGELPFEPEQFDVIWSEGAIYNIGFTTGIENWKKFLKPNGVLVATEITWLTPDVPEELSHYWASEYPEVATASTKIKQLEDNGYTVLGYFPLLPGCWLTEYYEPLKQQHADFLARNDNNETAQAIVDMDTQESALYEKYKEHYSYGCYIAQKRLERSHGANTKQAPSRHRERSERPMRGDCEV